MAPRLPVLSARDVLRALGRAGFVVVSQRGSHIRLKGQHSGKGWGAIVPNHDELTPGTLGSILRQAGMTRERFLHLLR